MLTDYKTELTYNNLCKKYNVPPTTEKEILIKKIESEVLNLICGETQESENDPRFQQLVLDHRKIVQCFLN